MPSIVFVAPRIIDGSCSRHRKAVSSCPILYSSRLSPPFFLFLRGPNQNQTWTQTKPTKKQDDFFKAASEYARNLGIPRIYISSNSGARIGLVEELKPKFKVEIPTSLGCAIIGGPSYVPLVQKSKGSIFFSFSTKPARIGEWGGEGVRRYSGNVNQLMVEWVLFTDINFLRYCATVGMRFFFSKIEVIRSPLPRPENRIMECRRLSHIVV